MINRSLSRHRHSIQLSQFSHGKWPQACWMCSPHQSPTVQLIFAAWLQWELCPHALIRGYPHRARRVARTRTHYFRAFARTCRSDAPLPPYHETSHSPSAPEAFGHEGRRQHVPDCGLERSRSRSTGDRFEVSIRDAKACCPTGPLVRPPLSRCCVTRFRCTSKMISHSRPMLHNRLYRN